MGTSRVQIYDKVRGEDLSRTGDRSMTGGWLDRGASRCDPKRGQREVAGEFSVTDSEGIVFDAVCGCCESEEEFHVRYREGYELRVRGRALHELRRMVAAWRNCAPKRSAVADDCGNFNDVPADQVLQLWHLCCEMPTSMQLDAGARVYTCSGRIKAGSETQDGAWRSTSNETLPRGKSVPPSRE